MISKKCLNLIIVCTLIISFFCLFVSYVNAADIPNISDASKAIEKQCNDKNWSGSRVHCLVTQNSSMLFIKSLRGVNPEVEELCFEENQTRSILGWEGHDWVKIKRCYKYHGVRVF